jgi:hypothetical protein
MLNKETVLTLVKLSDSMEYSQCLKTISTLEKIAVTSIGEEKKDILFAIKVVKDRISVLKLVG